MSTRRFILASLRGTVSEPKPCLIKLSQGRLLAGICRRAVTSIDSQELPVRQEAGGDDRLGATRTR